MPADLRPKPGPDDRLGQALARLEQTWPALAALRAAGAPVLLGLSGGRDSVALFHALVAAGWQGLVACHLNHGLRGAASGQDAAFVRRLAARHGVPVVVERAAVERLARKQGQSVETAGRVARHAFFARVAREKEARVLFLAHHADDQSETVLANLCRGAGGAGLAGMRLVDERPLLAEAGEISIVRPLLGVRRLEIARWCEERGIAHREDASNAEPVARRNRLRHEVLPLLDEIFARDVTRLISRAALLARQDEECLNEMALAFLGPSGSVGGALDCDALRITPALLALHPAVRSRVLAEWLRERLGLPGIGFEELAAAQSMMEPGGPARITLPGGFALRRKARRLWVQPPA